MSSLNIIDKYSRPGAGPGSDGWCEEVKEVALERALETLETAKCTSADLVHLMKIRRDMLEIWQQDRKVVWMDPGSWNADEAGDEPKAA